MKKVIYVIMTILFYGGYFLLFDLTLGNKFPISPISNMIMVFILVVVMIPLSMFTTEKFFKIIQKIPHNN